MFRPLAHSHRRPHRRGTSFILIVVVGISVFAVVGTAFALFAMQQARLGQARKDAEGGGGVPPLLAPNPTDTVNAFLGGLIYDTGDTDADIFNALRGHSMARSMYGRDVSQFTLGLAATTPWNGVGLFREDVATDPAYSGGYNLTGDRARLINYTVNPVNGLPFLLDPEYMGQRYAGAMGTMVPVFDPTTRTFVGKNAGYSYADTKDFFAGAVDPVTGAVVQQSFHRDWLFRDPLRPATESTLHPNNANWINAQGVLLTLRPRPFEDPQFPRVPMNADGTYTGDVQNFPGGYTAVLDTTTNPPKYRFHSRNDSLWMDLGLPIITLPGNRKVQPMVAPLIVPIDGLFNASAHGSNYGGSYAGYGPWAVNMAPALGGDAAAVVTARNKLAAPQQRNGATTRAYNPYNPSPLPSYAPVAWDNTAASLTYPTGSSFTGLPSFGGAQSTNAVVNNHPSLFNPTEWPGDNTATLRTFGLGDTKRVLRHSFVPDYYAQADLVAAAPNVLYPNPTSFPYVFGTGQSTANNYRLDPSHGIRGLITTRGYELDRPKVAPSFVISSVTMSPPPVSKPFINAGPYPTPTTPGAGSDFAAANRWVNALASLGSVNVNRPLADYRDLSVAPNVTPDPMTGQPTPTPQPLSPTNMGNQSQADSDRQALANDIFVRLVAAMGAATVNPATGLVTIPPPGTPQYDVCRYLAQLAVNIVDYIDNDDISTAFTWNAAVPGAPEVVYGVEKPRLVVNEVYSEIVNGVGEPRGKGNGKGKGPQKDGHVRFWVELLNPTSPTTGAFDGSAQLRYPGLHSPYQLVIARATRKQGAMTADGVSYLSDPANTKGDLAPGYAPEITYTFSNPDVETDPNKQKVAPNNGTPDAAGLPSNGIALVGPKVTGAAQGQEFDPLNNGMPAAPWTRMIEAPAANGNGNGQEAMEYQVKSNELDSAKPNNPTSEYRRHVVLLRRLANPYIGPSPTNPYITVDVMDYVPANDGIFTGGPGGAGGGTPMNQRIAIGKVQPYAGRSVPDNAMGMNGTPKYTFPTSMVLAQTPSTPPDPNDPQHTFGRHNYTGGGTGAGGTPFKATYVAGGTLVDPDSGMAETLMAPFDWLVHMDRPLVNPVEAFQVRDSAPHRVTDQFITPDGGAVGVTYEAGVASWTSTTSGLTRALEYLTVKPFTAGVPHGGRVSGKIAVNAIPDKRVISGLFDPQPGNGFNTGFVDSNVWRDWMGSRGTMQSRTLANGTVADAMTFPFQGPVPNSVFDPMRPATSPYGPVPSTTDDPTTGVDKPFYSLGAPAATADPAAFAYAAGGGEDLTIIRRGADQKPMLYMTTGNNGGQPYSASLPGGPTYVQAEPLRKVFNNVTTVSHTYLVFFTVGYFDVVDANPPPPAGWPVGLAPRPKRGAEAYITVPGDMRQKFVAMIDMSNMSVAPAPGGAPFFTSLEATEYAPGPPPMTVPPTLPLSRLTFVTDQNGKVVSDGVVPQTPIVPGTTLVLGYGVETQVVTVQSVQGPGRVTVTGMTRTAWAGSCVSNVQPGYPGPQPGFAYTTPGYKPVVPYIERLR